MLRIEDLRQVFSACDVCVVDDTEKHLIFAIRVSKNTLRANHHMLASVSERISAGSFAGWSPDKSRAVAAPSTLHRRSLRPAMLAFAVALMLCVPVQFSTTKSGADAASKFDDSFAQREIIGRWHRAPRIVN